MYVLGLTTVSRVEEKSVRPFPQHDRHCGPDLRIFDGKSPLLETLLTLSAPGLFVVSFLLLPPSKFSNMR